MCGGIIDFTKGNGLIQAVIGHPVVTWRQESFATEITTFQSLQLDFD
jgi:hypothetical protein